MPGFPLLHQLPELAKTHVHLVGGAILSSHPLSIPFSSSPQSFPASVSFQISQLFASGGQSIKVESIGAKVFSNIEVDKTKIKIEKEGFRFCKFCLNISNEKHSY